MTCEKVKPLLSEFADEKLDVAAAWQVQTHLAECTNCGRINREMQAVRQALATLPVRQPSAQFEANLAQRLALTRRPPPRRTWRDHLPLTFPGSRPLLRPAFALGLALTTLAAVTLAPQLARVSPQPPAVVHAVDGSFVADCVAQHRRDAAGEPLADFAAQNLAGHLDSTANPAPSSSADVGPL